MYAAVTLYIAMRKPFWEDEFFTLYLSRISPSETWKALLTGGDQHPPLFYWATHWCMSLFGVNHVGARIPAIATVALLSVCLYRIASRRFGPVYGLVGLLAPLVTTAQRYSHEARGYAWALGFGAAAMLCWLEAADGRRRPLALVGLALSLALAVSGHYYAILLLAPLGLGELVRTLTRRKIDFAVWAAFLAPAVPLALYAPVIRAARGYSATFWGAPDKLALLESSSFLFMPAIVPLVALVLFAALFAGGGKIEFRGATPAYEVAAAVGLLGVPLVAMALAMTVTNGFAHRYALYPVIGFGMLLPPAAWRMFGGRTLPGLGVAGLLFASFGVAVMQDYLAQSRERAGVGADIRWVAEHAGGDTPIVLTEAMQFYRMSFYAPRGLASRFVYLADPEASRRLMKHDTIDRGLIDLAPWFPLNAPRYREWLAAHPQFYAYGYLSFMTWQMAGFLEDHVPLEYVGLHGVSLLMRVGPAQAVGEAGRDRSLCDEITGDRLCGIFY